MDLQMSIESNTRKRRKPQRYGETLSNSSAQSEEIESFADDSFDDETYTPENDVPKNKSCEKQTSSTDDCHSFDKEFEDIESATISQSKSNATELQPYQSVVSASTSQSNGNKSELQPNQNIVSAKKSHSNGDETELQPYQSVVSATTSQSNGNKSESQPIQRIVSDQERSTSENTYSDYGSIFQLKVLEQLELLTKNTVQVLTRIATIEESLLKNGAMTSVRIDLEDVYEDNELRMYRFFVESNQIPFKTVNDFKAFEKILDGDYRTKAVSLNQNSLIIKSFIDSTILPG